MTQEVLTPAVTPCIECGNPLPAGHCNSGEEFPCANCGTRLEVEVFPALFRGTGAVKNGEALRLEGEASCFYHPHKRAAVLCDACGRFICSLCETELSGRCLCPVCIDKGHRHEEIEQLVTQRTLHDSLALVMAILPMLFFPFTVITAPLTIYIAVRHWKKPGSILPRTKFRFVAAIIIALAQIAGWMTLLFVKVL